MENSKLIQVLSTFNSSELRAFKDFIRSPFFNKNQDLILFYDYLKPLAPQFPSKKIQREYIWKKLYPNKKYRQKDLNYLMSFTLKLIEQFIGYQEYSKNEIQVKYHVLDAYIQRKLEKNYLHVFRQSETILDDSPFSDAPYYYHRYLLADIANQNFLSKRVIKNDPTLQQAATYFDHYYLANKLRYCCEQIDRNRLLKANKPILLLDELKDHLQREDYSEFPPIAVYHQILLMLLEPQEDHHFEGYQKAVNKHRSAFPIEEQKQIHSYAQNYLIRKLNHGGVKALTALFDLYQQGIDQKLVFENDELSPWTFKNAIKIGLRLNRFDWVESFIQKNTPLLAEGFRENATHYNMAEWHYYQGALERAQEHLIQVEQNDLYYSLDSRKLLLKIYFEQSEDEALWSLLASFRMLLVRNKLAVESTTKAYLNFVDILKRIARRDPNQKEKILDLIAKTPALPDRKWLMEQSKNY